MDKTMSYLAIARKGGRAELGEEPVGDAARALHAHLVIVAFDASDHTWRRAKSYVAGTNQQCLRVPNTKDEMGQAVGRTELAIAAITDAALALALVQSLPDADRHQSAAAVLQEKADKLRLREREAKAHEHNKRFGKKKNG